MNPKQIIDHTNHMPDETIGKENIPAPIAEPAVSIIPVMTDLPEAFIGGKIH